MISLRVVQQRVVQQRVVQQQLVTLAPQGKAMPALRLQFHLF
jgi:hypothetical protein